MEIQERDDRIQGKFMKISHMYFTRIFQQLSKLGVHPGQCAMLWMLRREDGLSQNELSKRLKVKPSTVAVSIRRMEKSGLIERRADREDMRKNKIYLTEHAKSILEESETILDENEKLMTEGLSETERCLLLRLLDQIIGNLERMAPYAGEAGCPLEAVKEEEADA